MMELVKVSSSKRCISYHLKSTQSVHVFSYHFTHIQDGLTANSASTAVTKNTIPYLYTLMRKSEVALQLMTSIALELCKYRRIHRFSATHNFTI